MPQKSTSSYSLEVSARRHIDADHFLSFLKRAGRRHARPLWLSYQYVGRGRFTLRVTKRGNRGVDRLVQELVLNRGLFYYRCTVADPAAVTEVILPITSQLIEQEFDRPHERFLRKHILGRHAQKDFIPGHIAHREGRTFELLFTRWDLGMLEDKEYIIALDAVIHEHVLRTIGHPTGQKSAALPKLLGPFVGKTNVDTDTLAAFRFIHTMRTVGLHRLGPTAARDRLQELSFQCLRHFQYLDEYLEAQTIRTLKWTGKRYRRIPYGAEPMWNADDLEHTDDKGKVFPDWQSFAKAHRCGDCNVRSGELHVQSCDMEECPRCGGQMISYDCGLPDA
jgi:hypothetical protein